MYRLVPVPHVTSASGWTEQAKMLTGSGALNTWFVVKATEGVGQQRQELGRRTRTPAITHRDGRMEEEPRGRKGEARAWKGHGSEHQGAEMLR